MKMKDIKVGRDYRVNYMRMTTVTVLETGLKRQHPQPSDRKEGVRVRFQESISGGDSLPWVNHEAGSEGVISQRCFLREVNS
jgi:hypothetical protein